MESCPYDETNLCTIQGVACKTCPFYSDYLDEDYDCETEEAMRVDYDETDPY